MSSLGKKIPNVQDNYGKELQANSARRKKKEFFIRQCVPGASLYIDGRKLEKTKVGNVYCFHIVNGFIDHFEVITQKEISLWDFPDYDYDDPIYWCDVCAEEEDDSIPF